MACSLKCNSHHTHLIGKLYFLKKAKWKLEIVQQSSRWLLLLSRQALIAKTRLGCAGSTDPGINYLEEVMEHSLSKIVFFRNMFLSPQLLKKNKNHDQRRITNWRRKNAIWEQSCVTKSIDPVQEYQNWIRIKLHSQKAKMVLFIPVSCVYLPAQICCI